MGNSFNFRDVENDKLIKRYNIAASGVLWKTCSYGLNLEGICYNKECQAYKHRVIICVGYGTFSITSPSVFHVHVVMGSLFPIHVHL